MDYKYIDKILKLRELADPKRGGTRGEQENASRMADHLQAKHGITDKLLVARKALLNPPRFRAVWYPDPPPSAARVARENGFDPVKFRRWLRAQGLRGESRDEAFRAQYQKENLIRRYKAETGS